MKLQQLKLMIGTCALVIGGVAGFAAAQGPDHTPADRTAMKAKWAEKKQEMLAKFDANKNGVLDPAEKVALHEARAEKRFDRLDANNDGVLSLDEFKAGKRGFGHRGHRGHRGGMGRGMSTP